MACATAFAGVGEVNEDFLERKAWESGHVNHSNEPGDESHSLCPGSIPRLPPPTPDDF